MAMLGGLLPVRSGAYNATSGHPASLSGSATVLSVDALSARRSDARSSRLSRCGWARARLLATP